MEDRGSLVPEMRKCVIHPLSCDPLRTLVSNPFRAVLPSHCLHLFPHRSPFSFSALHPHHPSLPFRFLRICFHFLLGHLTSPVSSPALHLHPSVIHHCREGRKADTVGG